MKHIPFTSFCLVLVSSVLHAAAPVEAQWTDVCRVAAGQPLTLTTADGSKIEGYCFAVSVDQISIRTQDRGVVKVTRSALSRISMHLHASNRGHELRALGHGMRVGLRHGFGWLFSPDALMGIVTIPATLAWGAVSAPFCAIGDVAAKLGPAPETEREIHVI